MDSHPFNTGGSSLPLLVSLDSKLRELAYVRRNPIEGRKSVFAHLTRPTGPSSTLTIGMNFIFAHILRLILKIYGLYWTERNLTLNISKWFSVLTLQFISFIVHFTKKNLVYYFFREIDMHFFNFTKKELIYIVFSVKLKCILFNFTNFFEN